MELAGRAMELASRVVNSKAAMNLGLIGAFGLLSMRSVHQQRMIETLESEKESLINSNKAVKKALWDSKQHLYAEADSSSSSAAAFVPPLSALKLIYNDAPTPPSSANPGKGDGKPAPSKILI